MHAHRSIDYGPLSSCARAYCVARLGMRQLIQPIPPRTVGRPLKAAWSGCGQTPGVGGRGEGGTGRLGRGVEHEMQRCEGTSRCLCCDLVARQVLPSAPPLGMFCRAGWDSDQSQNFLHFNAATESLNCEHEARASHSPPYEMLCPYSAAPPPVLLYLGCSNRCHCLFAANFAGFITHTLAIPRLNRKPDPGRDHACRQACESSHRSNDGCQLLLLAPMPTLSLIKQ